MEFDDISAIINSLNMFTKEIYSFSTASVTKRISICAVSVVGSSMKNLFSATQDSQHFLHSTVGILGDKFTTFLLGNSKSVAIFKPNLSCIEKEERMPILFSL